MLFLVLVACQRNVRIARLTVELPTHAIEVAVKDILFFEEKNEGMSWRVYNACSCYFMPCKLATRNASGLNHGQLRFTLGNADAIPNMQDLLGLLLDVFKRHTGIDGVVEED